jgi:peptidoglycan/LPS O-acetylase OafA/YrhL
VNFIATASYAVYLFHFSVTYLFERGESSLHWAAIFMLGSLLGCAVHALVERPLLKYLRTRRVILRQPSIS